MSYSLIYADSPWEYGNTISNGAAENHYGTMKLIDIKRLPVWELAAEDSVLAMWFTGTHTREAIELAEAWGFKVRTMKGFTWVKFNSLAEQKQRLSEELAVAAPKAEFVDRYVTATGSMTFRQVAKLLNAKEPEFAMFLIENGIMYRLNRVLTPKSKHIEAGRFEVKTGTTNQTNYAFNQSHFTAKGVRWIGGLWAEHIAKGQIA